jgi:hypothetical protein
MKRSLVSACALLVASLTGCVAAPADGGVTTEEAVADNHLTFEEFEARTPRNPDGAYMVEVDLRIWGIEALRDYFENHMAIPGALKVDTCVFTGMNADESSRYCKSDSEADNVWSSTDKLALTYCVSKSFGSKYDSAVTYMAEAAIAWERSANVMFTHRADQDGNCTDSNSNVKFNVVPASGVGYYASAFFPNYTRQYRDLEISLDSDGFWNMNCYSKEGALTHELGHVLGFRHEHVDLGCTGNETSSHTRDLTTYDVDSVMHYAQCAGKGCSDQSISSKDKTGAQSLYGTPGILSKYRWLTKSGAYQSTGKWTAGDFNNDGKDDVAVAFSDNGNYSVDVYKSTGSSFAYSRFITKAGGYQSEGQWLAGDFNNDGKADLAVTFEDGSSGKYSIDAYISTGSGFTKQRWSTKVGSYQSEGKWVAGDFDNDGDDDLAVAFEDGSTGKYSINAFLSNGSSFSYSRWLTQSGTYQSEGKWVSGDFNGDGKVDMAVAFDDGGSGWYSVNAYLSSGSSFGYNRWLTKSGAYKSSAKWVGGDFDGDARADLGKAFEDGNDISIDVQKSTGYGYFTQQRWGTQNGTWQSTGSFVAGDFDGDGTDEIAMAWSDSGNYSIDVHKK